jgi:hypothetical protein
MMLMGAEVRRGKPVPKPQMHVKGVSVAIVVSAWENHIQGEGPHLERWVCSNPAECEGGAYWPMSAEHSEP